MCRIGNGFGMTFVIGNGGGGAKTHGGAKSHARPATYFGINIKRKSIFYKPKELTLFKCSTINLLKPVLKIYSKKYEKYFKRTEYYFLLYIYLV